MLVIDHEEMRVAPLALKMRMIEGQGLVCVLDHPRVPKWPQTESGDSPGTGKSRQKHKGDDRPELRHQPA